MQQEEEGRGRERGREGGQPDLGLVFAGHRGLVVLEAHVGLCPGPLDREAASLLGALLGAAADAGGGLEVPEPHWPLLPPGCPARPRPRRTPGQSLENRRGAKEKRRRRLTRRTQRRLAGVPRPLVEDEHAEAHARGGDGDEVEGEEGEEGDDDAEEAVGEGVAVGGDPAGDDKGGHGGDQEEEEDGPVPGGHGDESRWCRSRAS